MQGKSCGTMMSSRILLFDSEHSGQRNYITLVYRRIPCISRGGDDVVIQPAIQISAGQIRIRILATIRRFYF